MCLPAITEQQKLKEQQDQEWRDNPSNPVNIVYKNLAEKAVRNWEEVNSVDIEAGRKKWEQQKKERGK